MHLGNSLIPHDPHSKEPGDQFPESKFRFDFMLSNPPFGVTWGGKDGYEKEARKLEKTRYQAGMPRVNDGALLFLQTMLAKMKEPEKGAQPHRHHLQRLAALQWRLRLGRERNPPLDSGERLARRHRHAARPALLQHRHLHLHLAAAERQARLAPGPRDADRRPPAVREGAEVLRQQAQPHHRRAPRLDRGSATATAGRRATPTSR